MKQDHRSLRAAGGAAPHIRLSELLGAFSYALDITEGQPEGHCVRASWIASEIGRKLKLPAKERRELFYTVLLKDLGCSSNAARICQLYGADDRAFKRDFKLVGTGLSAVLGFVFSTTAPGARPLKRVRAVADILRNGPRYAQELIQTRCERGADIARRLRFSEQVANGIYHLDEHWDGSGRPGRLSGAAIPLFARVALLAQVADVFHSHGGPDAAAAEIARRSGTWLDPHLAGLFAELAHAPAFWETLAASDLDQRLLSGSAGQCSLTVDENFLDDIAAAFGQVIDAKSPFTGGHSTRVADYAEGVAELVGYQERDRRWLRRGALLHDIGKLGVSNAILDKPGKLDETEWTAMRDHAWQTGSILGRITPFHDLAPLAAAHHERLDGTGYPLGLSGDAISIESRIITVCDFYDALTADRPYRGAMPVAEALNVIRASVGSAVDPRCFAALEKMVA